MPALSWRLLGLNRNAVVARGVAVGNGGVGAAVGLGLGDVGSGVATTGSGLGHVTIAVEALCAAPTLPVATSAPANTTAETARLTPTLRCFSTRPPRPGHA
jgi:hypothetical protein